MRNHVAIGGSLISLAILFSAYNPLNGRLLNAAELAAIAGGGRCDGDMRLSGPSCGPETQGAYDACCKQDAQGDNYCSTATFVSSESCRTIRSCDEAGPPQNCCVGEGNNEACTGTLNKKTCLGNEWCGLGGANSCATGAALQENCDGHIFTGIYDFCTQAS